MRTSPELAVRQWLTDAIEDARWFSGKGRGGRVRDVRPLTTWADSLESVRSWLVQIEYPDSSVEHYQVVIEHAADGPREPSASGWQDFWVAVTRELRGNQRLDDEVPGWADLAARLLEAEQSNTSLLIGDALILKVNRRLERGLSVETEMADLLDGEPTVPRSYATVGIDPGLPRLGPVSLLRVSEQLPGATDGWQVATGRAAEAADFTAEADALGSALRRVHRTLARRAGTSSLPGAEIAAAMTARLESAIGEVPALAEYASGCRAAFDALAGRELEVQRVHGDFHLGQTLRVAPGDWRIIDFAGEPLKTVEERRAPDAVQRDLAGMLRSFGYAGRVGAAGAASGPGTESAWTQACREAFVSGYHSGNPPAEHAALRAYEIDKAVYDVVYETRNRPSWVPIALSALADAVEIQGEN